MPTTFYDIYQLLCRKAGKSDNAVAAEIGLSNATVTTWRKGALPRRPTIAKVAHYFGVDPEYLLGGTVEAQIDITKNKLRHLDAVWDFSEECERPEVERQIEETKKLYKNLCATRDRKKIEVPEYAEGSIVQTNDGPIHLEKTYLRLAEGARDLGLDEEDVDAILAIYRKHKQKNQ